MCARHSFFVICKESSRRNTPAGLIAVVHHSAQIWPLISKFLSIHGVIFTPKAHWGNAASHALRGKKFFAINLR